MKKLISSALAIIVLAISLVGSACFADEIREMDNQYIKMVANSIKSELMNITTNNTVGTNITNSAITNITANNTGSANITGLINNLKFLFEKLLASCTAFVIFWVGRHSIKRRYFSIMTKVTALCAMLFALKKAGASTETPLTEASEIGIISGTFGLGVESLLVSFEETLKELIATFDE